MFGLSASPGFLLLLQLHTFRPLHPCLFRHLQVLSSSPFFSCLRTTCTDLSVHVHNYKQARLSGAPVAIWLLHGFLSITPWPLSRPIFHVWSFSLVCAHVRFRIHFAAQGLLATCVCVCYLRSHRGCQKLLSRGQERRCKTPANKDACNWW